MARKSLLHRKKKNARFLIENVVTVIVVLEENQKNIEKRLAKLHIYLSQKFPSFELLIVNNGAFSQSKSVIAGMLRQMPNIRELVLLQRYKRSTAVFAALEQSIGDVVVVFDPFTMPLDIIDDMIKKRMQGIEIVTAKTAVELTTMRVLAYRMVSLLLSLTGVGSENRRVYFLASREVVMAMLHMGLTSNFIEQNREFFQTITTEYKPLDVPISWTFVLSPRDWYSLSRIILLAILTAMVFFKWIFSTIDILFILVELGLVFFIIFSSAVLNTIDQIFSDIQKKPKYHIFSEHNSLAIIDSKKTNVV